MRADGAEIIVQARAIGVERRLPRLALGSLEIAFDRLIGADEFALMLFERSVIVFDHHQHWLELALQRRSIKAGAHRPGQRCFLLGRVGTGQGNADIDFRAGHRGPAIVGRNPIELRLDGRNRAPG